MKMLPDQAQPAEVRGAIAAGTHQLPDNVTLGKHVWELSSDRSYEHALDRHAHDASWRGVQASMISKLAGPRWQDPHQLARISETSLNLYRRVASTFADWLDRTSLNPVDAESWDGCL